MPSTATLTCTRCAPRRRCGARPGDAAARRRVHLHLRLYRGARRSSDDAARGAVERAVGTDEGALPSLLRVIKALRRCRTKISIGAALSQIARSIFDHVTFARCPPGDALGTSRVTLSYTKQPRRSIGTGGRLLFRWTAVCCPRTSAIPDRGDQPATTGNRAQ
jgi:hypothetical protein